MGTKLVVRFCKNCKKNTATEVERLLFIGKQTSTCQECGCVETEEVERD